jgi:hypothetical protein
VVGETHFSGPGDAAATDEAGVGDGVVGRTEGAAGEGLAGGEAGEPRLGRTADRAGGRPPGGDGVELDGR